MNTTILSLLGALALYGLSSLALPQAGKAPQDDDLEVASGEAGDPPPSRPDDFTPAG